MKKAKRPLLITLLCLFLTSSIVFGAAISLQSAIRMHHTLTDQIKEMYLKRLTNEMNERYSDSFSLELESIEFANGIAELSTLTSGPPYNNINTMLVYDKENDVHFKATTNTSYQHQTEWNESFLAHYIVSCTEKICEKDIPKPENVTIEKVKVDTNTTKVVFSAQCNDKIEYHYWKNVSERGISSVVNDSKTAVSINVGISISGDTQSAVNAAYEIYRFYADFLTEITFAPICINENIEYSASFDVMAEGILSKEVFCERMGLTEYL